MRKVGLGQARFVGSQSLRWRLRRHSTTGRCACSCWSPREILRTRRCLSPHAIGRGATACSFPAFGLRVVRGERALVRPLRKSRKGPCLRLGGWCGIREPLAASSRGQQADPDLVHPLRCSSTTGSTRPRNRRGLNGMCRTQRRRPSADGPRRNPRNPNIYKRVSTRNCQNIRRESKNDPVL